MYFDDINNAWLAAYDQISTDPATAPSLGWTSTAESWWGTFAAFPWASGGFVWTGFDYRGEPTPYNWPAISTQFGVMDTCGFPKDNFYYYQANWSLKPVLHILPHWNWAGKEGQSIPVWAYGNCEEVELFLNGVSQGRQSLNVRGHLKWDVPYTAGTLQAVGYTNGVPVLTDTVVTTGAPAAITLTPDRSTIFADGRDISIITVAAVDSQGRVVPTASNLVNFSISGGMIIGVGNGNPSSHEADKGSQRSVFNGLAQIIVQSDSQSGPISLTATSPGLTSSPLTITKALTMPPPAAPTNVAAVAGNAQVTVSWDIVHGATTYNLLRATSPGGPYTPIAANIGGVNLGYVDTSAANQTTYYYVVTANGAFENGASANSTEVSATPNEVIATPNGKLTGAVIGSSGSWGDSGNTTTNVFDGNLTTFYDAVNDTGDWAGLDLGSGAAATVTQIKYCPRPGFASRMVDGQFQGSNVADFSSGVTTLFTVTSAPPEGTMTVQAVTNASSFRYLRYIGPANAYCNVAEVEFYTVVPSAPTNLTAAPGSAQITLSWSAVSGATGYTVQRSAASGGSYSTLATGISGASYTDTGLANGATWYYTVATEGPLGTGIASAPVSATTYTAQEIWRLANFGTIANSGNAADSADPDGDGMTNAQEFISGTNPNSLSSVLKISQLQVNGNDFQISFPTVLGKTYRIERSDTLANGSWTSVLTSGIPQDNIAGTGGTIQITDTGGAAAAIGKRFYRVVVW